MNKRHIVTPISVIAFLIGSAMPVDAAHEFQTGEIASLFSNQNVSPSVAVQSGGNTFVVAYKLGAEVFVDQWDGAAWTSLTSFVAGDVGVDVLGDDLHIVIDPNGDLHVAFACYTGGLIPSAFRDIYYAFYDVTAMMWTFEQVERYSHSGGHVNPDNPRVRWNANSSAPEMQWTVSNTSSGITPSPYHSLNYAARTGPDTWAVQTIHEVEGPGAMLDNAVFAIGPDGVAHSSFMLRPARDGMLPTMLMNSSLMYGNNSMGNFAFMPIVTGDNTMMPGKANSIGIGPTGNIHIAYYDYLNDALHHIANTSGSFVDELVDSDVSADLGRRCVIEVNSANEILIAYQDHTNGKLKAAFLQNGDPWHIQTIANDGVQNARFIGAAFNVLSEAMVVHDTKIANLDKRLSYGVLGPCPTPVTPTGIQATDGTSQTIVRLSWIAAPQAAGYRVYRSTVDDSGTAQLIGTTDQTTFDDVTAEPPGFGAAGSLASAGLATEYRGYSNWASRTSLTTMLCLFCLVPAAYMWRRRVNVGRIPGNAFFRMMVQGGLSVVILAVLIQLPSGCNPPPPEPQIHYYWVKAANACGTASDFSASDSGYRGLAKAAGNSQRAGGQTP